MTTPEPAFDLVSLGEVMLRLSPPKYTRLRQMASLDVVVAGAQLNIAANAAQLGMKSAFVTRLPDSELGLLARDTCAGYGVDMRHVQYVSGTRMGINYLEFGATPRAPVAIFDRKGSAASTIIAEDFDWSAILTGVRVAHTDGIFPALGDGTRTAAHRFLETARENDCLTTFDVNYREHLWTAEAARDCWNELLPLVDVVVTNRGVSEAVFGFTGTDDEIMRHYRNDFGCKVVCLTHREIDGVLAGAWSSKALTDDGIAHGERYAFDVIDRFGTGDAFFAGFIYGYLRQGVEYGLNFGNAACAYAHTIEGDVLRASAADIDALLHGPPDLRVRR